MKAPSLLRRLAAAALILAAPGFAQISGTCDGTENLTGADMFPQTLNPPPPLVNNLTMTGTGCIEVGFDAVTCFVPQSNCTIDITCGLPPNGAPDMAVNLYQATCSTTPAACQAASSSFPPTLTNQSVTGGLSYCVVCEIELDTQPITIAITENTGSCGALPVSLLKFSVGGLEEGGASVDTGGDAGRRPESEDG